MCPAWKIWGRPFLRRNRGGRIAECVRFAGRGFDLLAQEGLRFEYDFGTSERLPIQHDVTAHRSHAGAGRLPRFDARRNFLVAHVVSGIGWAYFATLGCGSCGFDQVPVLKAVILLLAMAATAIMASSMTGALLLTFTIPVAAYAWFDARTWVPVEAMMAGLLVVGLLFFAYVAQHLNRASRMQMLWRLRIPSALPYFFGGLRISSGLALIGAVVAEFVAGTGGTNTGLAYQILMAGYQLDIPRMFAALLLISLAGVFLFVLMAWLTKLALGSWHASEIAQD